ncbi:methylosome protein 50-like [Copidosoma floridanum]|uniref:methylosome protein 50 n=1 Tax=Copidosoma floridanum TaxID=29053 RepID=UPI0006C982CE|nr:methylosome protein 50 [Copidosoma floridanum]XP_014210090.1 methylosome protein 50-like [Copidosoma floridanum]
MEQQTETVDPNLNAEAYRNLTLANNLLHDKQLEVVIVHRDDSLVLGASNMVDRYWYGTLWYFSEPVGFDRNSYSAATRTESGVRDAVFLGKHDKFFVGEDSGLVQIYEVTLNTDTKAKDLQFTGYSCQHDDSVTSIAAFYDNTHTVSGGMDCNIKIWDTTEMITTLSFNQAQTNVITGIAAQFESDTVFVSTSLDSEALLWDIRDPKPATGLWEKQDCGLTAVSWKPNDQNVLALGAEDGSVIILDIRHIGPNPIHESVQFPRGVRKLLFNTVNPTQLAGCCDSTEVKVLNVKEDNVEVIFENNAHSDFVRGLAWHQNDLITCSWDNTVLRHSIVS